MPKTIPCWDCKGRGEVGGIGIGLGEIFESEPCETCNGGGVLSVYTQAELDEAVQARNEDCASVCDKKSQDYGGNNWSLAKESAEAIRARNK